MKDDASARAASFLHLHLEEQQRGAQLPPALSLTSVYHLPGDPAGARQYGRSDNATWEALEQRLGHLEQAETVAFPSGMAAITAALLPFLKAGDRILLPSDGYYTTRLLADRFLAPLGIACEERPTARFLDGDLSGFRIVFVETPSNPALALCDLRKVAEKAHAGGALVVADNTTMTPYGQRPLDLGVDLVVAADTKAPNGHSDVLLGHVASRSEALTATIREWRKLSGSIPGPFECWLAMRGLETLELRFDRMCSSAQTLAERLKGHKALQALTYPGLPDHPSHALAKRQMLRFGTLIGLTLPSESQAEKFIATCPLLEATTSFGGVHSSAERRARWGDAVAEGFVRLSVGCEPVEELWQAIDEALVKTL